MFITDKFCKIFESDDITCLKYNKLYDFAVSLCEHKNNVSLFVY